MAEMALRLWLHAQRGCRGEVERELLQAVAEAEEPHTVERAVAQALRVSVLNNHADVAAALIASTGPAQLHEADRGLQLVHVAAMSGSTGALHLLLAAKANAESQDEQGHAKSPLGLAAENGHLGAVQMLVAHKVNVDATDAHHMTALAWAALEGYVTVAHFLLESKAHVDWSDGYGATPLSWAADGGHCDAAALLLHNGAVIDSADEYGQTPLSLACRSGHVAFATLLLDSKASLEHAGYQGATPLAYAVMSNHITVAEILLERGANIHCVDARGRTPLAEVCARQLASHWLWLLCTTAEEEADRRLEMARFLLGSKASVDRVDLSGETPLSLAMQSGCSAVASLVRTRIACQLYAQAASQ